MLTGATIRRELAALPNLFNHRLQRLMLPIWRKYRYRARFVSGAIDPFSSHLFALIGLGGDRRDSRSLLKEGSVALLFNPRWAVGVEYREKPDNLSFAGESDWADVFVGYFPNKHVSFVLAYARLGEIATLDNQNGTYLSVQGSF